jgi:hypothetical protein
MKLHFHQLAVGCLLGSTVAISAALSPEQLQQLPPPATHQVNFSQEIKPLLETSCLHCHGRGKNRGGFSLDDRESLLTSGDSGPAVIPGRSQESYFIELVSGLDPDNVMPQKGTRLTAEQVGLLRAWIDQGAKWDEAVSFGRIAPQNLSPPKPKLPAGADAAGPRNPIDMLLEPYFEQRQVSPGERASDRIFARRVFLDLVGMLPSPAELEEFENDARPGKRALLARRLLGDKRRYAEHWLTFWNDLLRNDYKGTGYIDQGRKQITPWLYAALAENMPFNRFVEELVNPTPQTEGFVNGIIWRGVVNASQTQPMQAAQNISQVFMGVNLKCASCHDSFINDWTLADAYGLASIYAEGELEMVECDKPTGKTALMKFLYPELGTINSEASRPERLKQLAGVMTGNDNGRLPRTIVNRIWARLMGRGLVEPLDDMEKAAWHPELLDWLAADLVGNGYDLRKVMERIVTSEAYQSVSVPAAEVEDGQYQFQGPHVRRLSAEQFQDAVASFTGAWHSLPENLDTDYCAGAMAIPPDNVSWIWSQPGAASHAEPRTVFFLRTIELPGRPEQAGIAITCDNSFKLFINGREVLSASGHGRPRVADIRRHLRAGENVFAVAATNDSTSRGAAETGQGNPAGLLLFARIRCEAAREGNPLERIFDLGSNNSWVVSENKADGWEKPGFDARDWQPAFQLGDADMDPWKIGERFRKAISAAALAGQVRAALVASDPLMNAMGRPNREQVVTTRPSAATTLQILELTNGRTLAAQLGRGAEQLAENFRGSARELTVKIFKHALSREPTDDELRLAQASLESSGGSEGIEDLLWALVMLPEFQLIY